MKTTVPRTQVMSRMLAECVSGVLIEKGRVLVEKRRDDDEADPGFVLLPGGHMERGESFEQALVREMDEELGIHVRDITKVGIRYHTATDGERQRVHYFHVRDWKGTIKSREAERVYWEAHLDNLSDASERRIVSRLLKQEAKR